jgi:hypothetical protein
MYSNRGGLVSVLVIVAMVATAVFACEPSEPPGVTSTIVDYKFASPEIKSVRIPTDEGQKFETFDQIQVTGLHNYGEPGEPVLPYQTAYILIPQNHELFSVEVTGERIKLPGKYLIEPGQVPIPTNSDEFTYTPPDPDIYESEKPFPASPYQVISVQSFRGYQILLVRLAPIEYIPVNEELSYFESMMVSVKTAPVEKPDLLYRGTVVDEERVRAMIDNPELLEKYPLGKESTLTSLPAGDYDMVIITNNALRFYWDAYASWKTLNREIETTVYTVEDIYIEYSGGDNQEKIRNFITDAFTAWGIEYVLLGGDVDIVPVRLLGPSDIPSNLYYGGLSGDWDYNNNNVYGESGEEDWLAEVYVGRVPVDNTTHIANFFSKVEGYEKTILTGYRCEVLFLGGDGLSGTSGGTYKDDTEAKKFPSSGLTITKIYIPPYTPPCDTDVISAINAGTHIINHWGHGSTSSWADFLTSSEVDALTNIDYCFVYSVGCWTNAFDQSDAISEHFLYTEHGAFAYIGNTRSGWYSGGYSGCPGGGSSHEFEREFYDAIFNEHKVRLGPVLQDSKEEFAGFYQYTYYALNLLGDPSTPLRIGCDLLVRDHSLDDGSLPSDSAFWTSPDICVDAPPFYNGCPGTSENPEYGSTNRVYVTVQNISCLPANDVTVKLYWADPAGGILWPDDWNYIGSKIIPSIPAGDTVTTPYINWKPTGTAIGHRCLLATAECDSDPISIHNVQWDNNVAQLNVVIVDLLPVPQVPFEARSYGTEFVLNPPWRDGERDLKITFLGAPTGVTASFQIPPTVQIKGKENDVFWTKEGWQLVTVVIPRDLAVGGEIFTTAAVSNFVCDEKEVVVLEIEVPQSAGTGGEFKIRITEELNGEIIGGIDYIVRY